MSSCTSATNGGDRRVIVVCGASGAQGSSVAQHLLCQQEFAVKVMTRSPKSEIIQGASYHLSPLPIRMHSRMSEECPDTYCLLELVSLGAEVVVADFEEPESLVRAFEGAYGVFGTAQCTAFSYIFDDMLTCVVSR